MNWKDTGLLEAGFIVRSQMGLEAGSADSFSFLVLFLSLPQGPCSILSVHFSVHVFFLVSSFWTPFSLGLWAHDKTAFTDIQNLHIYELTINSHMSLSPKTNFTSARIQSFALDQVSVLVEKALANWYGSQHTCNQIFKLNFLKKHVWRKGIDNF